MHVQFTATEAAEQATVMVTPTLDELTAGGLAASLRRGDDASGDRRNGHL